MGCLLGCLLGWLVGWLVSQSATGRCLVSSFVRQFPSWLGLVLPHPPRSLRPSSSAIAFGSSSCGEPMGETPFGWGLRWFKTKQLVRPFGLCEDL